MGHPAAAEVLDLVTTHFAHLVRSPDAKQQPNAQAVANVVWALGTLQNIPSDDRLLDQFLAHFHVLLGSQDLRTRPDAQNIANTLWALKQLQHAPPKDVVSAMLAHLVVLVQTPGLQPTSQEISNCLFACAELGLSVRSACDKALLAYLFEMDVSRVDYQTYCNVAWSLVVMGCLTISGLEALLRRVIAKDTCMQLPEAETRQLHQALAWLKPGPGSQQMEAWSNLHSRLQAVAPEPALVPIPFQGQAEVYAALELQALPYKAQVPFGRRWAHAVLSSGTTDVLLVFHPPHDFMRNMPTR